MNHSQAQKNKPKTNPIQTQSKPVLSAVEWANFNAYQTQSQNPIYPQRAKIKHSVATAEAAKLLPWLDCVVCLRVSGSLTTKKHKPFCPKRRNS